MKHFLILGIIFSISIALQAQLETSDRTLRIDRATDQSSAVGLDKENLNFQVRKKGLKTSESQGGFVMKQGMNADALATEVDREGILKNADLKDYKVTVSPKAFQEGAKQDPDRIGKDEYMGDFRTTSKFIHILYKDSQTIDGDLIRVYNEDKIVLDKAYLRAGFGKLKVDLVPGFNRIDIQALNEGEGAPNTGHFVLYHDTGELIHDGEWYLSAGNKASFVIIKEQ